MSVEDYYRTVEADQRIRLTWIDLKNLSQTLRNRNICMYVKKKVYARLK